MEKGIEVSGKEVRYGGEVGVVNMGVGGNEEGLKVLEDGLGIDCKYGEGYGVMGIGELEMKKKEEGWESFGKGKELGEGKVEGVIEKDCK